MGRPMEPGFARAVERVLGHHRAGLAQAVAFDQRDMELGLEFLEHLRRATARRR